MFKLTMQSLCTLSQYVLKLMRMELFPVPHFSLSSKLLLWASFSKRTYPKPTYHPKEI